MEPFEPNKIRGALLRDLSSSMLPGAYALSHDDLKVAWVGRGHFWMESLVRNLSQLSQGSHACLELQRLFEARTFDLSFKEGDPTTQYRLLYQYYEARGYKLLSLPPTRWRAVLEVIEDPRRGGRTQYMAAVWNKTGHGRKILGAVFENVEKAREWAQQNFDESGHSWEPKLVDDEVTGEIRGILLRAGKGR